MIAVNTDASFRDDLQRAGVACCGALGRAAQVVDARDSLHAELLALLLAMSIAHARNVEAVTFRHDATLSLGGSRIRWRRHIGAATEARKVCRAMLAAHPRWKLKQVPRGQNVEANILARRVLKMEIGNEVQKSHCREAKQREQAA